MTLEPLQMLMMGGGVIVTLFLMMFAFAGPSAGKAQTRRLDTLKSRLGDSGALVMEAQMRKITAVRATKADGMIARIVPKPALLKKRLAMTGKNWTVSKYAITSVVGTVVIFALLWIKTGHPLLALLGGLAVGLIVPHVMVGSQIGKRVKQFNARFPDAIDLMVRGLRSGLPISETLGIVASEIPDPVGIEFRGVVDRIRIGKTMDLALEEAADRIGTPEIQFFCITLAIQRETGGNLAETLGNLSEVLRKRAQMKLKIKAMSSESKASAYIIGVLPFMVFGLIYYVNSAYMGKFFEDERLMALGAGGLVWMGIGAFIMSQMISFEI